VSWAKNATANLPPLTLATLLDSLGLSAEAEDAYREAIKDGKPEHRVAWLLFLGRSQRTREAVTELQAVRAALPGGVLAPVACQLALDAADDVPPAVLQSLSDLVETVVANDPKQRSYLAALKSLQGDYSAATKLSRAVLQDEPSNLVVANNLAFLLALKDTQHQQGLELLRQAMQTTGPVPEMLDTEATILLQMGEAPAALERFLEVVVDQPTGVAWLHLAQAYLAVDRKADALAAWSEAKRARVKPTQFHPLERPMIRQVLKQLAELESKPR
jgi:tetratricopeptide (TPR) repeat protein